jgi:uncharacterized protein (DUF1778 family)
MKHSVRVDLRFKPEEHEEVVKASKVVHLSKSAFIRQSSVDRALLVNRRLPKDNTERGSK